MGGKSYPSWLEMKTIGTPPEWVPMMILAAAMTLAMIVLDIWTIIQHKKYSTRVPIQHWNTIGILQIYPIYALMYSIGMFIPNCTAVAVFISESYEALSFMFFLRLVLVYMGGKKCTKAILKGAHVRLTVPPICCLFCLPPIKFTRKYYVFCEMLITIYVFFCFVAGLIQMMMVLDGSKGYPSDTITGTFGNIYHVLTVVLLFFAIYGLSGIYHTAENRLHHKGIVKKFLVYKIFTLSAKILDVVMAYLVKTEAIKGFEYNEIFSTGLRIKNIVGFVIITMSFISFPLAVMFYPVKDYIVVAAELEENGEPDAKVIQNKETELTVII